MNDATKSTAADLTFNGRPIAEDEAKTALEKIYGTKRVDEILAGLRDGKYRCASVAGGYLEFVKPAAAEPSAPVSAPPES